MNQLEEELMRTLHQFPKLRSEFSIPGISRGKLMLMSAAWEISQGDASRGIRVSELVARLEIPASGVSRLLKGLEEDGILKRSLDPKDRRTTLVTFTEEGVDTMRKCIVMVGDMLDSIIAGMGEEKVQTICSLLDELYSLSASVLRAQEKKGFLKRETE